MNLKLLLIITLLITSCTKNNNGKDDPTPVPTPDTYTFAKGADISWVTQMESEGIKFYNTSGQERECTALMKEIGMNAIRLRVWVNPKDGWNNKEDVLIKALRAKNNGMRLMIDFHYSDTWADPGAQKTPAEWTGYNFDELKAAVYNHTYDVLNTLKSNNISVEWVQVGNETRNGMLYPLGECNQNNSNYAELTTQGYNATKTVFPNASVIVHLDSGDNIWIYNYIFDYLKSKNAKYDMIGMSLYPADNWGQDVSSCISNINTIGNLYNKNIIICEIGYRNDKPLEAKGFISTLFEKAKKETSGRCKGIFYWEPQAPAGYNGGYGKGAFSNGKPTEALSPFMDN